MTRYDEQYHFAIYPRIKKTNLYFEKKVRQFDTVSCKTYHSNLFMTHQLLYTTFFSQDLPVIQKQCFRMIGKFKRNVSLVPHAYQVWYYIAKGLNNKIVTYQGLI